MTMRSATSSTDWQTEKLPLAAYLIATDAAELVHAFKRDGGGVVAFALSCEPTSDQIAAFYNGSGKVSALRYTNTLTNLKAAVFEAKRGTGSRAAREEAQAREEALARDGLSR